MMDDKKPLVSVIVPVYNAEAYIERCVYSILNQTYDNLEVLLVDDGSVDQSLQKIKFISEKDDRIKVFHQENAGVSTARNKGIDMAAGRYLAFVDADDWLRPGMIELLLNPILIGGYDMALCNYALCKQAITEEFEKKDTALIERNTTEYIEEVLLKRDTRCWSKLYTRDLIGDTRFMKDITIGEDLLFLVDLLPKLKKTVSLSYQGYCYFNNESGAMQQYFKPSYMDQITCWKMVRDKITKIAPQTELNITGKLLMAIMLVVGKLSLIRIPIEQKKYLRICIDEIKKETKNRKALNYVDSGYRLKILVFKFFPRLYLKAYGLWKR